MFMDLRRSMDGPIRVTRLQLNDCQRALVEWILHMLGTGSVLPAMRLKWCQYLQILHRECSVILQLVK